MFGIGQRSLTNSEKGTASVKFSIRNTVLVVSLVMAMCLLSVGRQFEYGRATATTPTISDMAFYLKSEGPVRSNRPLISKRSRVLAALPTGNSDQDIRRVSKAVHKWNEDVDVDWAFFHYQPKAKWQQQDWYNKTVVLTIEEEGFLYGYFYKYLVTDYIKNLESYDWIWLLNSDCTFDELDAATFLRVLDTWQPALAQPAIVGSYWDVSAPQEGKLGRVTTFIEIGPFVAISVEAWGTLRTVINPQFNSGWGLDMLWCSLLQKPSMGSFLERKALMNGQIIGESMFCPTDIEYIPSCMVVDASPLVHLNRKEGLQMGTYSEAIGFKEKHWYREKYLHYWVESHMSLCSIFK